MAVVVGSAPDILASRVRFKDTVGKFATKVFDLGGAIDDTTLQEIFEDLNALTNAQVTHADAGGRTVTGMNASATSALQSLISVMIELTFSQVNPINAAKTVVKTFLIPAPVQVIIETDGTLDDGGTPGEGSLDARLARLIANLEDWLVYVDATDAVTVGGWTYQSGKSGLVNP